MSENPYAVPAPADVLKRIKPCGSKAGRADYTAGCSALTCADVEVIRKALAHLGDLQRREATPIEVEVEQLREIVRMARWQLKDPTNFWSLGGCEAWRAALAKAGIIDGEPGSTP